MDVTQSEFVRTVFKVYKVCVDPTAGVVALYGSNSCIGEWRKEEALFIPFIGMGEWQVETMLPKNTSLTYKLMLMHPRTRHVLQEEQFDRHLEVAETPMFVELTFDDMTCKTRTMRSKLTATGSPIALHLPTVSIETIGKPKLDTDYLMRDPKERWQFDTGSSYAELSAALKRQENADLKRPESATMKRSGESAALRRPGSTSLMRPESAAMKRSENAALKRSKSASLKRSKSASLKRPESTVLERSESAVALKTPDGTALQRPVAAHGGHPYAKRPPNNRSAHTQTDACGYIPSQVSTATTYASIGVDTTADVLFNTPTRSEERVYEESMPEVEETKTGMNDSRFTFRQMLPSPYRLAMLGLAVGACVYSKLKT